MPNEIGSLDRAILTAQNKLSQLLSLLAPGETDNVAIRIARNAVDKAKLAKQAATGSQQGMADVFRRGAGAAGGGGAAGQAGFITPATLGNIAGGAGLIGAGGLLLGGSTPSVQQAQQMQANPGPTWEELFSNLASLFTAGAAPSGNQYVENMMNRMGNRLGGTAGQDIPEAGPAGWVQNYFRTHDTTPLMADPNAEPGGTFAARFGRDFIPSQPPGSAVGPAALDRHEQARRGLSSDSRLPKPIPQARVAKQRVAQPRPNRATRI